MTEEAHQLLANEKVRRLLHEVCQQFVRHLSGIPEHIAKMRLGHERDLLPELVRLQLLCAERNYYFPRFAAFELENADTANFVRSCTGLALGALKRLYAEHGATDFTVETVAKEMQTEFKDADHKAAALGLFVAYDFVELGYFRGCKRESNGLIEGVTADDGLIDFISIEDSWKKKKQIRIDSLARAQSRRSVAQATLGAKFPVSEEKRESVVDFTFVTEEKIRTLIERDYLELQKVKQAGATLSRMIITGRLIEGLLLDAMLRNKDRALSAKRAPKEKEKPRDLFEWSLAQLIEVALELGFIRPHHEKQSHGVREFRNLAHPGWELRSQLAVREPEANIAEEFLRIVILDLPELSKFPE